MNRITVMIGALVGFLGLFALADAQTPSATPQKHFRRISKTEFELSYLAEYESNIYHAYYDTSETDAMLSGISSSVTWKRRSSRTLSHRAQVYTDFGLYLPSKYNNRNATTLGLLYEPTIYLSRNNHLSPKIDVSRRNKDVIDDTSPNPVRNLKKWELDMGLVWRLDLGKSKLEMALGYANHNYDENDTTLLSGAKQHLTSWDYKLYSVGGGVKVPVGSTFTPRADLGWEKRDYTERKTYTVQYGAFVGRPFAIRSYKELVMSTGIQVTLSKQSNVEPKITYTKRKDTFENFYGYTQWGFGLDASIAISPRLTTKASFEFKSKDYPNYWNSRIGRSHRESIDYADFSIEPEYQLSESVSLIGYLRNYNKVSNDPIYDYHDLTGGVGFFLHL